MYVTLLVKLLVNLCSNFTLRHIAWQMQFNALVACTVAVTKLRLQHCGNVVPMIGVTRKYVCMHDWHSFYLRTTSCGHTITSVRLAERGAVLQEFIEKAWFTLTFC